MKALEVHELVNTDIALRLSDLAYRSSGGIGLTVVPPETQHSRERTKYVQITIEEMEIFYYDWADFHNILND